MNRTTTVLMFFIAALLAGLFVQSMVPAAPVQTEAKETFFQRERGMPLDMVAVPGAVGVQGYNGTPPLLGSEPKPLSEKPYDMANDNELFQFSGNKMGAECCPSPFSGDRGCICLTDAQRKEFASRGGNR
jgi:hypothetical protein